MTIRKFRSEDLSQILAMTRECWDGVSYDQVWEKTFGKGDKNWWEYKADSLKKFIQAHPEWVLVAEEDGTILGYATYSINRERKIGEVLNNAVHPKHRGKGVGGALHRRVLEELKKEGMKFAHLVTSSLTPSAVKMYESAGFKLIYHTLHYAKKL